jgi:hypothetical protein
VRNTLRLAVVLLVAGVLATTATPAFAGGYSQYSFAGTATELTVRKQIVVEPGPAGIFWATQIGFANGDGGYFGMQANGTADGGRRERKMFLWSLWGTSEQRTSNPDAFCFNWTNPGEGGTGRGSTCRLMYDWRQGLTYRFRLRQTTSHWWEVAVTEEDSGRRLVLGSIRTPTSWGAVNRNVVSWDEEYAGNYPYAKVRTSVPTANDGKSTARVAGTTARRNARVSCADGWCTHEIGLSRKPATTPAPRPVTVKPSGDLAMRRTAKASAAKDAESQASQAVDWTANSAWRVSGANQWWQVDLGRQASLRRVMIDWDHNDLPADYRLQVSTNGTAWTTAASYGKPTGGRRNHENLGRPTARYLRVQLGRPATAYGVAIWDVQVFGDVVAASPTPPPSPTATPSQSQSAPGLPNAPDWPAAAPPAFGEPASGGSAFVRGIKVTVALLVVAAGLVTLAVLFAPMLRALRARRPFDPEL